MIFICRQKCDQGKDNDMNTRHFLIISNIQQCTASQYRLRNIAKGNSVHWPSYPELIQKTAFSLVKSRLAIGSPCCSGVCLVVTILKTYTEYFCWLPYSDHIHRCNPFQIRPYHKRGIIGPPGLLHSWHLVLFVSEVGNNLRQTSALSPKPSPTMSMS